MNDMFFRIRSHIFARSRKTILYTVVQQMMHSTRHLAYLLYRPQKQLRTAMIELHKININPIFFLFFFCLTTIQQHTTFISIIIKIYIKIKVINKYFIITRMEQVNRVNIRCV